MNCLEQNGHTRGNLLQSHKCTADTDTHHSLSLMLQNCTEGEAFHCPFRFSSVLHFVLLRRRWGRTWRPSSLPMAGRPEPVGGHGAPRWDASSGSPSLTPLTASTGTPKALPKQRSGQLRRAEGHVSACQTPEAKVSHISSFASEVCHPQTTFSV